MGGRCAAGVSVTLTAGGLVWAYVDRHLVPADLASWNLSDVFGEVVNLALPAVGFVLASRRPGNRIGWLFLVAGLAVGLGSFLQQYGLHAVVAVPGSLPAGRAVASLSGWSWVITIATVAFVLLLFSDRAIALSAVAARRVVRGRGADANCGHGGRVHRQHLVAPVQLVCSAATPAVVAMVILSGAVLVVSVAAVVVRFARRQVRSGYSSKWFAAAAMLLAATYILSSVIHSLLADALTNLAFVCLFAAIGIAVLKYRLYDIDIVISKAVLYGSLAVFITAVYAALVVGMGTLAGNRRSPLLAALAAAVVAVAASSRSPVGRAAATGIRLWPARYPVSGAVGLRPAPRRHLRGRGRAAADGPHRGGGNWRRPGGGVCGSVTSCARRHPRTAARLQARLPVDGHQLSQLPDSDTSVPVMHQGELLGAISVKMPKDELLRVAGQQLVADVASQAGLVLSNVGLIEDLRASRQRLVTAQDEARRRLERNIHDGAQQDLVALAIKLQLANMTVEDPVQTRQILGELRADTAGALENLRDLARGIYPPLLADLGLAAALGAQASKSPLPVTVEADGIGRFGQDVEAAVYFCCLEALQNTAKYAHATQAAHLPADAGQYLAFHHLRRRNRIQHKPHSDRLGPQEHGRPARRPRRPAQGPVRPWPGHHHHRISPPSPLARQLGPAHEVCHIRTRKPSAMTGNRGHSREIRATP